MYKIIVNISFVFTLCIGSATTFAKDRVALIIGNSQYEEAALANPKNDAETISAVLQEIGFSTELLLDAQHEEMEDAIQNFGQRLGVGTVGLFYYAGHAVQYNGKNYLVPVGAIPQVSSGKHLKYKTVALDYVLGELEDAPNTLNLLVLDSCRNNPFKRSFSRSFGASRGLAKSEESLQGVLIAYSTAPGEVAFDGEESNSPYTKHLAQYLKEPGLSIESVLKKVRKAVKLETKDKQIPWYESSIDGDFFPNPEELKPVVDKEQIKKQIEKDIKSQINRDDIRKEIEEELKSNIDETALRKQLKEELRSNIDEEALRKQIEKDIRRKIDKEKIRNEMEIDIKNSIQSDEQKETYEDSDERSFNFGTF